MYTEFSLEHLNVRDCLENLGIDGRINITMDLTEVGFGM
jgi:hypothetical protein